MKIKIIFSLFVFFTSKIYAEQEVINLYTYHNHPPFINAKDQGLTYELENFLNKQMSNKYKFKVKVLPRKRLNKKIKTEGAWSVIWVNPVWFGDKNETKYQWVNILEDANTIISRTNSPINYDGADSIKGLKFGGMAGHKYLVIDDLVKAGKLKRINGDHERDNLKVLLNGRIDFTLLPRSTINYLVKDMSLQDKIYLSPKVHQKYTRKILIPSSRKDLALFYEKLNLSGNTTWNETTKKYGL